MEYIYKVKVENKIFTAEFNYTGLRACQLFIKENGKPNKLYNIKVVKKGA